MEELRQLEKQLKGAVLRKRLVLLAAGIIGLVSTGLGIFLLLSMLAALFIIPVPVKIGLLVLSLGLIVYAFIRYLAGPFFAEGDIIRAALQVEKNHPDIKGRLVAALQFRNYDTGKTNFSRALMNMTGRQALALTSGINFNEIVSGYPVWSKARSGFMIAALAVAIGLLAPGFFSDAFEVYSNPTTRVAPPPKFSLSIYPGNVERVKYSDVEIGGALMGGGFSEKAEIFYRFAEGRWQSEEINLAGKEIYKAGENTDSLPFGITLKQVRRSFDYYVVAGEVRSETYAVNIVERPRVTGLKLTVTYPSYTGLEPMVVDENNGSVAALVGSRMTLEIEANREIAEGHLVRSDSITERIDFSGKSGLAAMTIEDDFSYHIRLIDGQGEENPDPIEYMVTAVPDEYPIIDVVFPGFDLNLDETMMIPFTLQISDDFGFSSLVLKYQVVSGGQRGQENVAVINFSEQIETEGEVTFNWDLDPFNLLPSDFVLYHFELADNDRISGPKITSTRVYAARLPSIDEIVMQTETQQEGRVFEAEKILREQKEMVERLRQLSEQIRASDKVEWQQQKDLENLLDKQQMTAEKLEEMARQMEESIKQMEKNDLADQQVLEKLMELQKLFDEVATPEMKEAMKKMAEALKNMTQEEIEQAMKEFQMSQEEMVKRLERSIELLKRMQIEQKMAAILKMIEEAFMEQNRVNLDTEEKLDDQSSSRLSQREQQLQKQMEAIKKEAGKLKELLEESPYEDSQGHHEFAELAENSDAGSDMKKMEEALEALKQKPAMEHGREASRKLGELLSQTQQLMSQLFSDEGQKLAEEMRKAIDDANYLSRKQEEIYGACEKPGYNMPSVREAAAEQEILRQAVGGLIERINKLSMQSPFLAAEVRNYLEQCMSDMSGSCDNLGTGSKRGSLNSQRNAIYNLNRTAVKLLDGLQNQKQCNKGGSCNKQGQKMQSLCQKQSQINQQTQGQCPNPGEKLGSSQKEGLKRLAAEQGSVRKSLQELQKEFGNRREILGRLDALAEEARQIEEMLDEGQVGDELIDRQLRIYSRMLDVEKSLNRRDYSRERRAVTAEDILRASPGPLEEGNLHGTETLQDRLNRYLQDGYPRQYEQQIKAYFKAISNMGQEQNED